MDDESFHNRITNTNDIPDVSFSSHINLDDLGLSLEKSFPINQERNDEIKADYFYNHKRLNIFFKYWRKYVDYSNDIQKKGLVVLGKHNKNIVSSYFYKWKDQFEKFEKLFEIGAKVQVTQHFRIWCNYIRELSADRTKMLKFILIRRKIYESSFFNRWLECMELRVKVKQKNAYINFNILQKYFKGFKELIKLKRYRKIQIRAVQRSTQIISMKRAFASWSYHIRLRRLECLLKRRLFTVYIGIFFDKWINVIEIRNKREKAAKKILEIREKHLLLRYLNKWELKVDKKTYTNQKEIKLLKIVSKKYYDMFFYKWVSNFNKCCYYSSLAESVREIHKHIQFGLFFNKWYSKFYEIKIQDKTLKKCLRRFKRWKQNIFFYRWKSKFYSDKVMRLKVRRTHKKLSLSRVNRLFQHWFNKYKEKVDEESKLKAAERFRKLSLMLKGLNRMKLFRDISFKEKAYNKAAYKYHELRLKHKILKSWTIYHRKVAKYTIMVVTVLKLWSKRLMNKTLSNWRMYINDKKRRKTQYNDTYNEYYRTKFHFLLSGFIVGSKLLYHDNMRTGDKADSSIDNLSITDDELRSEPGFEHIKETEDSLIQPRLPLFLIGSVN